MFRRRRSLHSEKDTFLFRKDQCREDAIKIHDHRSPRLLFWSAMPDVFFQFIPMEPDIRNKLSKRSTNPITEFLDETTLVCRTHTSPIISALAYPSYIGRLGEGIAGRPECRDPFVE